MPLTSEDVEKLTTDELTGRPRRVKGKEADRFLADFRRDVRAIEAKGGTVEIPSEIQAEGKSR